MSDAEYSILITSRNEGETLWRTVDDVVRHSPPEALEIVIVDDASDDGSLDLLNDRSSADGLVRTVRNEERRGLISSRARAAELARGTYFCFLDAHCSVTPGWLKDLRVSLERIDGRGIAVPVVHSLDREEWRIEFERTPMSGCTVLSPFLDFGWVEPWVVDGLLCTCTVGGMAWMCSREWYQHLGGLDREMLFWGGENIDMALRTWLAGGYCVIADGAAVGHMFRKRANDPIDSVDLTYNKIRAAHTVFSREIFHKSLERLKYCVGFPEAYTRLREAPGNLPRLKKHVESIRKRSDRWLMDRFQLPLLEPAFFYRPAASARTGERDGVSKRRRPRPTVSIVLTIKGDGTLAGAALASLLDRTTYANYEIIVCSEGSSCDALNLIEREPFRGNPRLRFVQTSSQPSGGKAHNLGISLSDAEYVALIDERTVILDEHWVEKFILLFERRPHVVMACPRTQWIDDESGSSGPSGFYDLVWDWSAPGFSSPRVGRPLAEAPYQALSCPETALFIRREAFTELGGFDSVIEDRVGVIKDFAIRTWLSGYEVFCHPGISVGRRGAAAARGKREPPSVENHPGLSRLLLVSKYFTNKERIRRCSHNSRSTDVILRKYWSHIDRERERFSRLKKFDDDALFYKFQIQDEPDSRADEAKRATWIATHIQVDYPDRPETVKRVDRILRETAGELYADLGYESGERIVRHIVCENPARTVLVLEKDGLGPRTDTVAVARADVRPDAFRYLVDVIEAEGLRIRFDAVSFSDDTITAVFGTDDNRAVEAVLRDFLILPDPGAGVGEVT